MTVSGIDYDILNMSAAMAIIDHMVLSGEHQFQLKSAYILACGDDRRLIDDLALSYDTQLPLGTHTSLTCSQSAHILDVLWYDQTVQLRINDDTDVGILVNDLLYWSQRPDWKIKLDMIRIKLSKGDYDEK